MACALGISGGTPEVPWATPASGDYTYLTHDHLGSVRGGWGGGQARHASHACMP